MLLLNIQCGINLKRDKNIHIFTDIVLLKYTDIVLFDLSIYFCCTVNKFLCIKLIKLIDYCMSFPFLLLFSMDKSNKTISEKATIFKLKIRRKNWMQTQCSDYSEISWGCCLLHDSNCNLLIPNKLIQQNYRKWIHHTNGLHPSLVQC